MKKLIILEDDELYLEYLRVSSNYLIISQQTHILSLSKMLTPVSLLYP